MTAIEDGGAGEAGEEIVVVRLEGLGTYAIPVADLAAFRLAEQAAVDGRDGVAADAVPVILEQDFLRGSTAERDRLTVDRFGGVHSPAGGPLFGGGANLR